ncbi:MAG TPA: N-6 DNA methylase [Candidatus Acidoferrum sp.]|nr:N-6 DNA methylase [Candidatus Acidoferrum sp.]
MANQRTKIYSTLWKGCEELRGRMDVSHYKEYVLVLLCVKWISDNPAPGRVVPKGAGFADLVSLKQDPDIGIKINEAIHELAEANDLQGVIDVADFADTQKLGKGEELVDRLANLIALFEGLDLRQCAEADDLLGDAYEFLLRKFATEAGRRQGQYYTPAEVGCLMAKLLGVGRARSEQTIYDPTCGSGSLLVAAQHEARALTRADLRLFGQDSDPEGVRLARLTMFFHGCRRAALCADNTLACPRFTRAGGALQTFDFVLANPPFSLKAWSHGFDPAKDPYQRFALGVPPATNGDYAFLLHVLASLNPAGKAAVILPVGVLFRGKAEGALRRALLLGGFIEGVVMLPPNLFAGTEMPACIVVLDKAGVFRDGIFLIDASTHFGKDGSTNRLRAQDVRRIVDAFARQLDIPGYARRVPMSEIGDRENTYNLTMSRYIRRPEPGEVPDLVAHLQGGVPDRDLDALARFWRIFPTLRATLFRPTRRPGCSRPTVPAEALHSAIIGHPESTAFGVSLNAAFERWVERHRSCLAGISGATRPGRLIAQLSGDLLEAFGDVPLIDPYALYQHLMTYWEDTMQDDVAWLTRMGWTVSQNGLSNPGLIPPSLMARCYFAHEARAIARLETAREICLGRKGEVEAGAGGEGALTAAGPSRGRLTTAGIKTRLSELRVDTDTKNERAMLKNYLDLVEQDAILTDKIEEARKDLEAKVAARSAVLTGDEIRRLMIDEKWVPALAAGVTAEHDRVLRAFTGHLQQLVERYATPFAALTREVVASAARLEGHLRRIGVEWE